MLSGYVNLAANSQSNGGVLLPFPSSVINVPQPGALLTGCYQADLLQRRAVSRGTGAPSDAAPGCLQALIAAQCVAAVDQPTSASPLDNTCGTHLLAPAAQNATDVSFFLSNPSLQGKALAITPQPFNSQTDITIQNTQTSTATASAVEIVNASPNSVSIALSNTVRGTTLLALVVSCCSSHGATAMPCAASVRPAHGPSQT